MKTDIKAVEKKIKDFYFREYFDKAKAADKGEAGSPKFFLTTMIVSFGVMALSPLALFGSPFVIAFGAVTGMCGLAGYVASAVGAAVASGKRSKNIGQEVEKDFRNGTLLARYQKEVLPKKYAKIKAGAHADAAKRKKKVDALQTVSKLTMAEITLHFNEKSGTLPDSGPRDLVAFIKRSLPKFGAKK